MEKETIFAQGINFKRPSPNAPDFVKGKVSIKVSEAIDFLQKHQNNDWVNLDLLVSKKDPEKLYFKLNDFKPEKQSEKTESSSYQEEFGEEPPF